jgi:hypothetical protein
MIQRIADDFKCIAASLKKLERDKEAAQANERLIHQVDEARERAKKHRFEGKIPAVFELGVARRG